MKHREKNIFIFFFYLLLFDIFTISSKDQPRTARPLPVVLIHGIMSDKYAMKPTVEYIQKYLPGTFIKNVEIGLGTYTSYWNMYDQVKWLAQELQEDPNLKYGCNIIAHSQGGLIARYFIQKYNKPRVYNYISWGSPQQGVFGTPGTIDERFSWLNIAEQYSYSILYTSFFQNYISFASYWHDPVQHDIYLKKCSFLPYANNHKEHELWQQFKENICSLDNMVLVKSLADDIIEPLESCHFGFYKIGSYSEIESLRESDFYKKDHLGLRTLDESGRLHLRLAQCTHTDFQEDEKNFVENTLPFLILPPREPAVDVETI